jgi:hypothetical protein
VGDDVIDRCGDDMPRKLASRRVKPRRVMSPGESGRSGSVPRGSVRLRFALVKHSAHMLGFGSIPWSIITSES